MSLEATARWSTARDVLCVRLDSLGDVLMTTPALRALKGARPGRRLTLLASAAGAAVARHVPEIDAVLRYDAPWVKADGAAHAPAGAADRAAIDLLAAHGFDAAVIFTVYSQSALPAALLCRLAGIRLRLAHCRENPYGLLSDWVRESEPQSRVRHEAQRQLDLVAQVGARSAESRLSFHAPRAAHAEVARLLDRLRIARRGFVVLHPGASASSRRYPVHGFAQVAGMLARARNHPILVTGSAEEHALAETVCALAGDERVRNVAGALDVGGLGALLGRASLLVSNNSGPVHIAAALGTPVVDLYALTNPQHTPWGVAARVLYRDVPCRYCYKSTCPLGHNACLHSIEPAEVVAAACALLDGAPGQAAAQPMPPVTVAAG